MTVPTNEMLAVAEHLRKHVNATPEVVEAAQVVADYVVGGNHPPAVGECPSLSPGGLALELERRTTDEPGHFHWQHIGTNLRRMVPGLKDSPKKAAPPNVAPQTANV